MFRNFFRDESGQGMVEYALIIALIAVVVITVLTKLGEGVNSNFTKITDELNPEEDNGSNG